jgi:hypothetical protein
MNGDQVWSLICALRFGKPFSVILKSGKMKAINLFKKLGVVILAAGFFTACESDDMEDNMYTISGSATGAQENPPVTTSGTANLSGSYNRDNNVLNYTVTWTGMTGPLTAAHFHGPAAVGVNAPPIFDISVTTNGVSGSASATVTLHDTTENHLLNGRLYYNLHTALYPAGEIRAQVSAVN